jgi:hypothetical protein
LFKIFIILKISHFSFKLENFRKLNLLHHPSLRKIQKDELLASPITQQRLLHKQNVLLIIHDIHEYKLKLEACSKRKAQQPTSNESPIVSSLKEEPTRRPERKKHAGIEGIRFRQKITA